MTYQKINIGLAGFGNIGSYFYKILQKNKKDIFIKTRKIPNIKYISARSFSKNRKIKIPKSKWIKNPESFYSKTAQINLFNQLEIGEISEIRFLLELQKETSNASIKQIKMLGIICCLICQRTELIF